ncbi:hypothetical protein V8F06_001761 [Rhypophila decipiens]
MSSTPRTPSSLGIFWAVPVCVRCFSTGWSQTSSARGLGAEEVSGYVCRAIRHATSTHNLHLTYLGGEDLPSGHRRGSRGQMMFNGNTPFREIKILNTYAAPVLWSHPQILSWTYGPGTCALEKPVRLSDSRKVSSNNSRKPRVRMFWEVGKAGNRRDGDPQNPRTSTPHQFAIYTARAGVGKWWTPSFLHNEIGVILYTRRSASVPPCTFPIHTMHHLL